MKHFYRSRQGTGVLLDVTPALAGWRYLSFQVVSLESDRVFRLRLDNQEAALVPLRGRAHFSAAGLVAELARTSVFEGASNVLYLPPGQELVLHAVTEFEFAWGSAPANGKYPVRLFNPEEMRRELRGGGAARRQVNHILAFPLPAERLILYEVYVPAGMWSGWPPHRHDGEGAPYLEETYYYRFDPSTGFGLQRNYRDETGFDELFTVKHGDVALVTQGYHPVACAPGANMYFLNYQAGDLYDAARGTPPYEDPAHVWIKDHWEENRLELPIGGKSG